MKKGVKLGFGATHFSPARTLGNRAASGRTDGVPGSRRERLAPSRKTGISGRMSNNLDARLDAFFAAYAVCGEVSTAAKAAGLDRNQVYLKAKADPAVAQRFADAKAEFADSLKAEALRRAREGTRKLLFHQGAPVYLTRFKLDENGRPERSEDGKPIVEYQVDENGRPIQAYESAFSDRLLLAMLAANAPDEYATKSNVQLTGAGGGPVQVDVPEKEIARRIAFLMHKGVIAARALPAVPDDPGGDLV